MTTRKKRSTSGRTRKKSKARKKRPRRRSQLRELADRSEVRYAQEIVGGEIVAGKWEILACQRFLDDLKSGGERGLYYDPRAADHAIDFIETFLPHIKGRWRSVCIQLEPVQRFIVGNLFGWKRRDGLRRFRRAYIEVARKNTKSTMAAAILLYLLVADGEPGAEVYAAATKRDQARIVFDVAREMVLRSPVPELRSKYLGVERHNIHNRATSSSFQPLGADADTMDGLNVHGASVDELHAHRDAGVYDVLDTATGARRQPLIFAITTAGTWAPESVCWREHSFTERVLEGHPADHHFGMIFAIDKEDDWRDRSVWRKANPMLGVSLSKSDLEEKAKKAEAMPGAENEFRRKHLDEWVEQAERWLTAELWKSAAGEISEQDLEGRECFAGLDLARSHDLSALELLFPPVSEGERWKVLTYCWIPAEDIEGRSRRDGVPYQTWRDQGLVFPTPGNATDFAYIRRTVNELGARFAILEVAYDRRFADQLTTELLDDGFDMVPIAQGYDALGAPTEELERMLLAGELNHGGNAVLGWAASNVTLRENVDGLRKPDKVRSTEKIDPVVALIMALQRAMLRERSSGSIYESDDYE